MVSHTGHMHNYPFTFAKVGGRLIKRVNRFVVEVEIEGRREKAYLANPGRLWELLLPGASLLLSPSLSRGKLPYTVLACEKEGRNILLHTHLTNRVIQGLIDERKLPAYEDYRIVRTEPAVGKHRFDLLLEHRRTGEHFYLEIKSVTLFAGRTAMFPDAVTERGASHLRLLKELAGRGLKTGCLFAIMNPEVKYFLPAYHVDYNFAETLLDVKDAVELQALALGFDDSFTGVNSIAEASIPYQFIREELRDRGVYFLLLYMNEQKNTILQHREKIELKKGCYIYVGTAEGNLNKEIARHKQKRKKKERPIDCLTAAADAITPIPVITGEELYVEFSSLLAAAADERAEILCSPDCRESEKLFYFAADPLHDRAFVDLIMHYRLVRPEQMLPA